MTELTTATRLGAPTLEEKAEDSRRGAGRPRPTRRPAPSPCPVKLGGHHKRRWISKESLGIREPCGCHKHDTAVMAFCIYWVTCFSVEACPRPTLTYCNRRHHHTRGPNPPKRTIRTPRDCGDRTVQCRLCVLQQVAQQALLLGHREVQGPEVEGGGQRADTRCVFATQRPRRSPGEALRSVGGEGYAWLRAHTASESKQISVGHF